MESPREKRREERFMIEMPVMLENGMGVSRDISQSGIYFMTEKLLQPGAVVSFSVKLSHIRPGKPVQLDCEGRVLRVEPAGGRLGVAATISEFRVH